eukprot:1157568-Pelagomonas_calceolata.AAC.11
MHKYYPHASYLKNPYTELANPNDSCSAPRRDRMEERHLDAFALCACTAAHLTAIQKRAGAKERCPAARGGGRRQQSDPVIVQIWMRTVMGSPIAIGLPACAWDTYRIAHTTAKALALPESWQDDFWRVGDAPALPAVPKLAAPAAGSVVQEDHRRTRIKVAVAPATAAAAAAARAAGAQAPSAAKSSVAMSLAASAVVLQAATAPTIATPWACVPPAPIEVLHHGHPPAHEKLACCEPRLNQRHCWAWAMKHCQGPH